MSAEDKKKWDEKRKAVVAKRDEFLTSLKKAVGFDEAECDNQCKADVEDLLLKHEQAKYKACQANAKAIACINADDLRMDKWKAMAGTGKDEKSFFKKGGMSKEERTKFEEAWVAKGQKAEAALAAAWLKTNKPAAGAEGGACGNDKDGKQIMMKDKAGAEVPAVCAAGSCCGYSIPEATWKKMESEKSAVDKAADKAQAEADKATGGLASAGLDLLSSISGTKRTPVEGELTGICAVQDKDSAGNTLNKGKYTDGLEQKYIHTCLANKLYATAAASIAVAYSLM